AFQLERSIDNVSFIAAGTAAADATSAVVSGLDAATNYFFRVRAAQGTTTAAATGFDLADGGHRNRRGGGQCERVGPHHDGDGFRRRHLGQRGCVSFSLPGADR